jgi:hypothetical protein
MRTLRGSSYLHDAIGAISRGSVRVPAAHEMGTITEAYGLAIDQFQTDDGGALSPIVIQQGEYLVSRALTVPLDYLSTTPDGVATYTTHPSGSPTEPDVEATPPDESGAHDHHSVGLHSHSWSGGDPQGGSVGGTTSADVISIDRSDELSPSALPYEGHHHHRVLTPTQLRPLQPGDRVLVAWVYGQAMPIVVDVVVDSLLIPTTPSGTTP